jgi:tetratricopeptide (TPR) repeat protein
MRSLVRALSDHDVGTAQLLLWILLKWYSARGRPGQAVAELSQLVDMLDRQGALSIDLLGELAYACESCGRIDLASARIAEADLLIQDGHRPHFGLGVLEAARALVLVRGGDPRAGHAVAMAAATHAAPHERLPLLNVAGMAAAEFGDSEQALDMFLECLQECRALDWPRAEAVVLGGVAEIECRLGRTDEAAGHLRRSLRSSLELGDEAQVALGLLGAARVASQRRWWPAALQMQVAGEDMLAATGEALLPSDVAISERLRSEAADQLGEAVESLEREVRSWDLRRTLDTAAELLDAIAPGDAALVQRHQET